MRIVCFHTFDDLAPYANDWDRLAGGVPFRSWTWLSLWWRHYGPKNPTETNRSRLAVLVALDDTGAVMAIAPWYLECSTLHGRVLRQLGTGEVCSDYLSILCHPNAHDPVVHAMADYLVEQALSSDPDDLRWELLELDSIDSKEQIIFDLADAMSKSGCAVHRQPDISCWRLDLPINWELYVASLGKNQRRDIRRMEREYLNTYRVTLHSVERFDELPQAMDILVDLHQRRREMLGEKGCFASERFLAFYRDVVPELLRLGQLEFHWLEMDGRAVAAEYQLSGDGVLYFYQAGVEPEVLDQQPGKIINFLILQRAIERGYLAFDFLRGDEPYKARFGARPRSTVEYRIVPQRAVARLRHNLWLAGNELKTWMKETVKEVVASP